MAKRRSSLNDEASLDPNQSTGHDSMNTKLCAYCSMQKPLADFKRRTGKRRGATSRRGACKACREKQREQANPWVGPVGMPLSELPEPDTGNESETPTVAEGRKKRRRRRPIVKETVAPAPPKVSLRELRAVGLIPTRKGLIRMRGKTDNGRRWYQEVEPDLALTLVKERAAVVVNRQTIRRLYSNKEFRTFILERDQYTCRFCGQYGDTIDHMLPRAKGGHTTPDNCVCACNLCNQTKADKDMDEFISLRGQE